jgi:phosphoglycerol transferase MdoB-like AlkP superfamily enzyme
MATATERNVNQLKDTLAAHLETIRSWLILIVCCFVGRLLWLGVNHRAIPDGVMTGDWAYFFQMGVRYDSVTITYFLVPFFVLNALIFLKPSIHARLRTARIVVTCVIAFILPFFAIANASYFQSNNNVFDANVFELFSGNFRNTFDIAVQEHNGIAKVIGAFLLSSLMVYLCRRASLRPIEVPSWLISVVQRRSGIVVCTMCLVLCVTVALRGRVGTRPLQRVDSGITRHRILNLGTLNPIYNLRAAWKDYRFNSDFFSQCRLVSEEVLNEHGKVLSTALASHSSTIPVKTASHSSTTVADFSFPAWQRTAEGPPSTVPKHVFILFMESYDSWPFLEKYRELGLVEEGRKLGDEGLRLMSYLPGDNSSLFSSLVCLQGMFETNRARQQCVPTSLAHAFNRMGYVTRNINGFSSEWSDCGRIAIEQGFKEVYCTAEIKPGGDTANFQVHDRTLFEFASEKLSYEQPTFNFIRSSSYHGPFEVDLKAENCEVPRLPDHLKTKDIRDEEDLCQAYGTLKYSDKMLGEFIRKMSERHPDSLFIITGDHYGRHFITTTPSSYEGSSVPLIMYGPQVLEGLQFPEGMAGSHVDLQTTLIELCAPKGFDYVSLGKNLLKPADAAFGVGRDFVIFPNAVVCLRGNPDCIPLPWLTDLRLTEEQRQSLILRARQIHDAYHGIGYMITRKSLETY